MKILILTQYYPPEVGAPQNRLSDLAQRLKSMGDEVSVLTAIPSYPHRRIYDGYHGQKRMREFMDDIEVHRTRIFVGQSNRITARLLNYFSFAWRSFCYGWLRMGRFDLIICESPPLILGITAWLLKKIKRARMLFNVSDLWPESAEKLGLVTNRILLWLATRLERFLYRHSDLLSGQTQGIVSTLRDRSRGRPVFWLRNGIDPEWFDPSREYPDYRQLLGIPEEAFVVFYGGIIGYAQGMEIITGAASLIHDPRILFVIAGEGPVREELIREKERMGLQNVLLFPAFKREEMPAVIHMANAGVIPLRKLELFMGAIPSKIFECLSMKKPVLLAVDGEARDLFIRQAECGLFVEPENAADLAGKTMELFNNPELQKKLGENGRQWVLKKFDRKMIAAEFREFIK
ncbi:MAG: glycosyltransferase family 4 protein [Bacteroidales bacterium]|nr:glycosyltransferase family 4 protein [Bacteroidales bacterium]